MILWALFFALGLIAGAYLPDGLRERVRGALRGARELVLGAAPASVSEIRASAHKADLSPSDHSGEVRPTPPNKPIDWLQGAKNIAAFFWQWRHVIVIGLVLFALYAVARPVISFVTCPFGGALWCAESRADLREQRDEARSEVVVKNLEQVRDREIMDIATEVAGLRAQLQEFTNRGRDEIAAATPPDEAPVDPDLAAAFRAGLDRLCVPRADGSLADSCE